MHDVNEIRAVLHAYRDFSECVVEAISIQERATVVEVVVDYIWKPDGTVRRDDEERLLVVLHFAQVQEVSIRNELRPAVVENPQLLGWSFSELSRVEVCAAASGEYDRYSVPFQRLTFRREDGPWIEVVFSSLHITESRSDPAPRLDE